MNSGKKVSLRAIVSEMDAPGDDWTAYLNPRTGEIISVSDEEIALIESDEEPEELDDGSSEWSPEQLAKLREVIESGEYLPLPGRDEIDEYQLMRLFAQQQEDARLREELLRALDGRGAFRCFKDVLHRHGRIEEWYAVRDGAFEDVAVMWLEANGIAFERDGRARS